MEDRKMFGTSRGVEEKVYKNPIPSEIIDAARRHVQRMSSGGGVAKQVGLDFSGGGVVGGPPQTTGAWSNEYTSEQLEWSESRDPLSTEEALKKSPDTRREIWSEFFAVPNGKLFTEVQKKHTPSGCCVMIPYMVLWPLIYLPSLCCFGYGCKWNREKVMVGPADNGKNWPTGKRWAMAPLPMAGPPIEVLAWDQALRQWQNEFSEKLKRYGLFVKTKSFCYVTYSDNGRQRHFTRWITIALNAGESRKLAQEPHLSGDIENCEMCGRVNEHELCAHPPCGMA
eukprot:g11583.t1